MKKFEIEWETDYCDDFKEFMGISEIIANSEAEAIIKFNKTKMFKACILNVQEIEK